MKCRTMQSTIWSEDIVDSFGHPMGYGAGSWYKGDNRITFGREVLQFNNVRRTAIVCNTSFNKVNRVSR